MEIHGRFCIGVILGGALTQTLSWRVGGLSSGSAAAALLGGMARLPPRKFAAVRARHTCDVESPARPGLRSSANRSGETPRADANISGLETIEDALQVAARLA